MYPYLKKRIVIVDGPSADGIYNLNAGTFQRINKSASELLRSLDGTKPIEIFSIEDRKFLDSCYVEGYLALQTSPIPRSQTPLNDVLRKVRPVRFAWIELTSKCNQLCKHCFLGDELNAFPPYSKEDVYEMLNVLHQAGARQIIFTGGEPVAHPDFHEILEFTGSQYPFKLSLLSNGSHSKLINVIPSLLKYDVTVKIPLLGWEKSHDLMSGIENGFTKTTNSIERLIEARVSLELGTTVTSLNYQDIPRVRNYANELGVPLEVSPLYAVGFVKDNFKELYAQPQETLIQICRDDKESQSRVTLEKQEILSPNRSPRYEIDPTDYETVNLRDYLTEHSECGQKIVAILASREVTACLMLREKKFSLGSLNQHNLKEILSHETYDSRNFDQLMKIDNIPGCSECEARFVCKAGGCPASSQAFAGSVQIKNPLFRNCYYSNDQTREEVGLEKLNTLE